MIVVDTNIIAYFYVTCEWTTLAQRAPEIDPSWVAPSIWRSELRNVFILYIRREKMTLEGAKDTFRQADELINTAVDENTDEILSLSASSGCTVYDCEFVAAAKALGVPLVTMDSQILQAFPETAISLVDFAQPESEPENESE